MNQNLFSSSLMPWINLLTLCFCLFKSDFVGAADRNYAACRVPRSCGDNQTIRFPFYIKGLQEPNCGYPGFELSCNENGQPILNLSNGVDYIIHQIFYHNQSFIVSNSAFSSHLDAGLCIPLLQNFSLPNERFELPKQDQAFLLYDCHPPRVSEYEIGCSEGNKTWVLGVPENDRDQLGNLSRRCGNRKVVVAPVKDYGHESVGIREVLSRGFDLKWKADDCQRCETSGGVCGFNSAMYLFHCYCRDGPHRVRCLYGQSLSLSL